MLSTMYWWPLTNRTKLWRNKLKLPPCTFILLVAGKFWGKIQGGKMWSMKFYNWSSSVHRDSPWIDNKLHKNDGQALHCIGNFHDVRCSTYLIFALFCSSHSIFCLKEKGHWHLPWQKMNKTKTQSIWWRKLVRSFVSNMSRQAPLSLLDSISIQPPWVDHFLSWNCIEHI